MSRICFVVGARPNFVKTAPLVAALRARDVEIQLVHTGQHYDREMSELFLSELDLEPDVFLGVGSGSHAQQTARALTGIEEVLLEQPPDLVVVSGDVNSTLAGALAAVKLHVPVCHLEAGLRSFDPLMPEEHNRRVTDHLSDLLLVHSQSAVDNLSREGIRAGVHLVGNTMIDSLYAHLETARAREPWAAVGMTPKSYALVTLHRPSLVDDSQLLLRAMRVLVELSQACPVVFPVHPRTRARLESAQFPDGTARSRVVLTEPLSYLDFIGLEAEARFVVTDSGGVQEETSALGVPCFTVRDTTERPITVEEGTNTVLGGRPEAMAEIPRLLASPKLGRPIPLWDGAASSRAAGAVMDFLVGSEAYVA